MNAQLPAKDTSTTPADAARCVHNGSHLLSSRHIRAACPAEPTRTEDEIAAEQYDRAITQIKRMVDEMNKVLGYNVSETSSGYSTDGLTFGYIGNIPTAAKAGSKHDDRSFSVFLPHPGRPGRYEDRFGGFSYGSLAGARGCLSQLAGALQFAKWQQGQANGGFPVRSH